MQHPTQPESTHNYTDPSADSTPPHTTAPQQHLFFDILRFTLIAIVIVVPIRLFIAQPFIVQGASMHPTFETGQYLVVDQLSYRFAEPERGEIVVFRHPLTPSTFLIKRIVGLPGETIEFRDRSVRIVNEANPEGFVLDEPYIDTEDDTPYASKTVTLGSDEYFALGDNRDESADSRVWGPLDRKFIVGKALIRLLPVSRIHVHPGEYNE